MEIHFQQQQQQEEEAEEGGGLVPMTTTKTTMKFKGRSRRKKSGSNNSSSSNKYVGVRQRPSGRWVAEIKDTTQKIRMWLGTFETAEEAARAYDEAACLLRGTNTRTNFVTTTHHHHLSHDSPLASRIRILLNNKKKANQTPPPDAANDSRITTTNIIAATPSPSSCRSSSVDSLSEKSQQQQQQHSSSNLFDDAYKPDLSNCLHEFQMGSSCYDHHHHQSQAQSQSQSESESVISSWGLLEQPAAAAAAFDYRVMVPFNHNQEEHLKGEMEFSEFERMKVERQISASLYAMNGVHEYMENVSDPIEAFWDLPPLCSLLLC